MNYNGPVMLLIMTTTLHSAQISQLRGASKEVALETAGITLDLLIEEYPGPDGAQLRARILEQVARALQ